MHPWFVSTCCCRRLYRLLCPERKRESKPTHSRKINPKNARSPLLTGKLENTARAASPLWSKPGHIYPGKGWAWGRQLHLPPPLLTAGFVHVLTKSVWRSHAPYDFPNKKCFIIKVLYFGKMRFFATAALLAALAGVAAPLDQSCQDAPGKVF